MTEQLFDEGPYVLEQERYCEGLAPDSLIKWAERARDRADWDALDCLLGIIDRHKQSLERENESVAL